MGSKSHMMNDVGMINPGNYLLAGYPHLPQHIRYKAPYFDKTFCVRSLQKLESTQVVTDLLFCQLIKRKWQHPNLRRAFAKLSS